MAGQNRNVIVLFLLISSMTVGALVLMVLDNHPPLRGDGIYSLTSYHRHNSEHKRARALIDKFPVVQNHLNTYDESNNK